MYVSRGGDQTLSLPNTVQEPGTKANWLVLLTFSIEGCIIIVAQNVNLCVCISISYSLLSDASVITHKNLSVTMRV